MNKKQLYESVMRQVSREVKKALNEMAMYNPDEVEVGDLIRIIRMDDANGFDKSAQRMAGKIGIVEHIDSIGQLHGTWGSLAVIPDTDEFEIIQKNAN